MTRGFAPCRRALAALALAAPSPGETGQVLGPEEGSYENGRWVTRRRWNGDQTDYGFNFPAAPVMLRVRLGTYR